MLVLPRMNDTSAGTAALTTVPLAPLALLPESTSGDRRIALGIVGRRARRIAKLALAPILVAAPLAMFNAAARVAFVRPKRRRAWGGASLGMLIGTAFVGLFRWQLQRWFTDQPRYDVERTIGPIELRRYPAMLLAQTTVWRQDFDDALVTGFRRLARYIGGTDRGHSKIPMTTPVVAWRDVDADGSGDADAHAISFIVPSGSPTPLEGDVVLRSVGPRRIAVHRFRGDYSVEHVRALQRHVIDELVRAGVTPIGEPQFAGYDPPTTLPALRRVEIWVEIA